MKKNLEKKCFDNKITDLKEKKIYPHLSENNLEIFFLSKFGLPWGKLWPLCTFWCNSHIFLDILELIVENKKMSRENRLENEVSDL